MKYWKRFILMSFMLSPAALAQEVSRLDFGMMPVGALRTKTLLLTNYNNASIYGISHTVSGDTFIVNSDCPDSLRSGLSCRFQITLNCSREGHQYGSLEIATSDKDYQVHLSGYCNRIPTPEPRPPAPRP